MPTHSNTNVIEPPQNDKHLLDETFMLEALQEAKEGLAEGGIPIGSVLVMDNKIIGRGHNQRIQKNSAILHAEMACIENAGRLSTDEYRRATLYSTLSPCHMCTGAILLYGIPRVVIGENSNFQGPESLLHLNGVEVIILNSEQAMDLMKQFILNKPKLWNEDIGE